MENSALFILWRIVLAVMGLLIFYMEIIQAKDKISTDGEDDMVNWWVLAFSGPFGLLFIRYTWYGLSALLIFEALTFTPRNDSDIGPFNLSEILFLAAVARLVCLKFTTFAKNKDKFLVDNAEMRLIGEAGILLQDVNMTQPAQVKMVNPVFKNDIIDCIADTDIKAGERVKVLEVDCGLLKVTRV